MTNFILYRKILNPKFLNSEKLTRHLFVCLSYILFYFNYVLSGYIIYFMMCNVCVYIIYAHKISKNVKQHLITYIVTKVVDMGIT